MNLESFAEYFAWYLFISSTAFWVLLFFYLRDKYEYRKLWDAQFRVNAFMGENIK